MRAAMAAAGTESAEPAGDAGDAGDAPAEPPQDYEWLLRELVDERTYPRLYRLAWNPALDSPPTEREKFLFGMDLILDGVQALIDRAGGGY